MRAHKEICKTKGFVKRYEIVVLILGLSFLQCVSCFEELSRSDRGSENDSIQPYSSMTGNVCYTFDLDVTLRECCGIRDRCAVSLLLWANALCVVSQKALRCSVKRHSLNVVQTIGYTDNQHVVMVSCNHKLLHLTAGRRAIQMCLIRYC